MQKKKKNVSKTSCTCMYALKDEKGILLMASLSNPRRDQKGCRLVRVESIVAAFGLGGGFDRHTVGREWWRHRELPIRRQRDREHATAAEIEIEIGMKRWYWLLRMGEIRILFRSCDG